MSKSFLYNQRLVLKINSKRLRYNNWDLNVTLEEAKKNEELVSLGDSIVLRMIRQIRGNNVTEDDINQTKRNIKKYKSMTTNKENKARIKREYEKLTEQTFIEDYIMIVFDSIGDWNKANSPKINLKIGDSHGTRFYL